MYWKNNEKKFSLSCTNFHQKQWAQNPQKFVLCLTPTLDFHTQVIIRNTTFYRCLRKILSNLKNNIFQPFFYPWTLSEHLQIMNSN